MIKLLTIISFVLFSTFSFAQKNELQNFISQAYQQIVPANFAYYNLMDSSFVTEFDKYSLEKDELQDLLKNNPDFPLDDFIRKGNDTALISWANYKLNKANVYSYNYVPKFSSQIRINRLVPYNTSQQVLDSLEKAKKYNEVIVPVKSSWSDNRKRKEIEKAWTKYAASKKSEDKIYFRFSTPIFSHNGLYAIITLNQADRGATHIFKKVDGRWTEIFMFRRWVS